MTTFELRQRIKASCVRDVDGQYYYFPPQNGGALSQHTARIIASVLEELNEEWEKEVKSLCDHLP